MYNDFNNNPLNNLNSTPDNDLNTNQVNDTGKKNNKGLIVFLILIILGLSCYIVYDKIFVKNNSEVKQEENKTEVKKVC